MAWYFEKPDSFSFRAGQFVELQLLDPPETDSEGDSRTFSLASAPSEQHLMVTSRLRDTAFKRVLAGLPLESTVSLEGPFGTLTIPEDASRSLVCIAGGIGITPFRSMVIHAIQERRSHRILMLYSNRRPEDAPFLEELQRFSQQNPHYRFVPTMTNAAASTLPWSGETGRLNPDMLTKYVQHMEAPLYYVVGPPDMVQGMRTMLHSVGVNKSDIQTEEFAGY